MSKQNQKLTGYPSIDRPWLKYYSEEAKNITMGKANAFTKEEHTMDQPFQLLTSSKEKSLSPEERHKYYEELREYVMHRRLKTTTRGR